MAWSWKPDWRCEGMKKGQTHRHVQKSWGPEGMCALMEGDHSAQERVIRERCL